MRRYLPILFAWWFVWQSAGGNGTYTLILSGPFLTEAACKKVISVVIPSDTEHWGHWALKSIETPCFSDSEKE